MWQDNDQPGADYIAEVARLATEAGATVKGMVSLDWFLAYGPLRDKLPDGWDAADALEDGITAENIQATAEATHSKGGIFTLIKPAQQEGAKPNDRGNSLFKDGYVNVK